MSVKTSISFSHPKVIETYNALKAQPGKKVSRFFEDAALYYLESVEEERISRETVKDIVLGVLKDMVPVNQISNQNYVSGREQLIDDVMSIMEME